LRGSLENESNEEYDEEYDKNKEDDEGMSKKNEVDFENS
jgi:hypothetical protein